MVGPPEPENLARLLPLLETLVASLPAEQPQAMADRLIQAMEALARREARSAVEEALEKRAGPAAAPQVPALSAEEIYDAVAERLRPHMEKVLKESMKARVEPENPIVQELAWRLSESRRRHRSSR